MTFYMTFDWMGLISKCCIDIFSGSTILNLIKSIIKEAKEVLIYKKKKTTTTKERLVTSTLQTEATKVIHNGPARIDTLLPSAMSGGERILNASSIH